MSCLFDSYMLLSFLFKFNQLKKTAGVICLQLLFFINIFVLDYQSVLLFLNLSNHVLCLRNKSKWWKNILHSGICF